MNRPLTPSLSRSEGTAIELSPAAGPHWQAPNLNPNRNLDRLRFLEIKSKITIKIGKKPFRLNSMAVHPVPLPRERGFPCPARLEESLTGESSRSARPLLPLLGERVGVRASVHSNETSRQQVPNEGRKDGARLRSGDKSCHPTEETGVEGRASGFQRVTLPTFSATRQSWQLRIGSECHLFISLPNP